MEPLTAAIVELRDRTDVTAREKQLEFFVNHLTYVNAYLTCSPRDAVIADLECLLGLLKNSSGDTCCGGHLLSEAHMRHGNCFVPTPPSALAMEWTEKDQERAWSDGWLLLLDDDDLPYVTPVPEGRFAETHTAEMMLSHCRSSPWKICQKAAALIERKRAPRV